MPRVSSASRNRRRSPGDTRPRSRPMRVEDLGRDVDLGVLQAVVRQRPRDRERRGDVVLGRAEEAADLGVEEEEAFGVADAAPRGLEDRRRRRTDVRRARRAAGSRPAGRQPSKCRWQSARSRRGPGQQRKRMDRLARFAHSQLRRAALHNSRAHYMRRARLLALFLDVLVCAALADAVGLARHGLALALCAGRPAAIPWIWAALAARPRPAPSSCGTPAAAGRGGGWRSRSGGRRPPAGGLGLDPAQSAPARPALEPLRRLAARSGRGGAAARRPAYGNPYLAVRMRVARARRGRRPVRP